MKCKFPLRVLPAPDLLQIGTLSLNRPTVLDLGYSICEAAESAVLKLRPVQENPARGINDQRRAWEFVVLIPNVAQEGTWFRFSYGADIALFVVDIVSSANAKVEARRDEA